MQLPEKLQVGIEYFFENVSPKALQKAREALTRNYQERGISPFGDESKRLAYLGARMPATFAAIHKVLQNISLKGHVLDLGAGPGTATWAVLELFPEIEKITLIEQSADAITLGKGLLTAQAVKWVQQDLTGPIPRADAAILSYVVSELKEPVKVIRACWNAVETLIIVEPGTPKAFHLMKKIRQVLIDLNAYLIAPCPHFFTCPNDWCHFSARVERTRLHRLLKGGSLGFEDEKFCYLIAAKSSGPSISSRIIRHPMKQSGHVKLSLCTDKGMLVEKTISRKDKELYREARNSEWGRSFIRPLA